MLFIAGRINPDPAKFLNVNNIRKAIETCPAEDYTFVNCDDLEKVKDNLHYSTKGLVELGYRYARKLQEMTN